MKGYIVLRSNPPAEKASRSCPAPRADTGSRLSRETHASRPSVLTFHFVGPYPRLRAGTTPLFPYMRSGREGCVCAGTTHPRPDPHAGRTHTPPGTRDGHATGGQRRSPRPGGPGGVRVIRVVR